MQHKHQISFGSGFEAQGLARPFIELPSHSVELRMRTASGSSTPPRPHRIETSNISSTHRLSTPSLASEKKCCVDRLRPPHKADITRLSSNVRFTPVGSIGRCNTS